MPVTKKQYEQVQEVLLDLLPGQDVRLRITTDGCADLCGFWCWDMTILKHRKICRLDLKKIYRGREFDKFKDSIARRVLRWKDIEKRLAKIKGNR